MSDSFHDQLRDSRGTQVLQWAGMALFFTAVAGGALLGGWSFAILIPAGILLILSSRGVSRGSGSELTGTGTNDVGEELTTLELEGMSPYDRGAHFHRAAWKQLLFGIALVGAGVFVTLSMLLRP
jgi:hypothetical protein